MGAYRFTRSSTAVARSSVPRAMPYITPRPSRVPTASSARRPASGPGRRCGEAFGHLGAEVGAQDVALFALERGEDDPQQGVGALFGLAGEDVADHVAAQVVQGRVQQGVGVGPRRT